MPKEEIAVILRDHGFDAIDLMEGCNELVPPLNRVGVSEVGWAVQVYMHDGSVSEVAIDSPSYLDPFRALAYDLMSRADLVMLSSDGGSMYACGTPATELPPEMVEQFEEVNLSIASITELP